MKKCYTCQIVKNYDEFYKNKSSRDGYSSQCGKCNNEQNKLFAKNNPEISRKRNLKYRLKHSEEIIQKDRIRYIKDFKKIMLSHAKGRAKRKKLPFDMKLEDFEIPEICPIFGINIEIGAGKRTVQLNSPTLDRIIPEKGYVKGNIQVISHKANMMKNCGSLEEMIKLGEFAKKLLEEAKKND
jgi:hypothetical protein